MADPEANIELAQSVFSIPNGSVNIPLIVSYEILPTNE